MDTEPNSTSYSRLFTFSAVMPLGMLMTRIVIGQHNGADDFAIRTENKLGVTNGDQTGIAYKTIADGDVPAFNGPNSFFTAT
jgi:hypothetical protein